MGQAEPLILQAQSTAGQVAEAWQRVQCVCTWVGHSQRDGEERAIGLVKGIVQASDLQHPGLQATRQDLKKS